MWSERLFSGVVLSVQVDSPLIADSMGDLDVCSEGEASDISGLGADGPRLDPSPNRTPVIDHAAPRTPPLAERWDQDLSGSAAFLPGALTIPGFLEA